MKTITLTIALSLAAACSSQQTPTNSPSSAAIAAEPAPAEASNIVDVAVKAGQFQTLIAALEAADLAVVLEGDGPFTVFAPTDAAFAKLPEGTVEALLANPDQLAKVLTYHVVSGRVLAADVVNLDSATTVQGQSVAIDTTEGVRVGGAMVISADVMASNGVIHVIDTVLLPN